MEKGEGVNIVHETDSKRSIQEPAECRAKCVAGSVPDIHHKATGTASELTV